MHLKLASAAIGLWLCVISKLSAESTGAAIDHSQASVTAVTPNIFRISVNTTGDGLPIHSAFIDPAFVAGDFGKRSPRGLATNRGLLSIDPKTGALSLSDAKGSVLLPAARLVSMEQGDVTTTELHLGWPADRPFNIYGCGNGKNELQQQAVKTRVGNGVAVEPFFYSPAGFAIFVVSNNEDHPATCDGKVTDGTIAWSVPGAKADLYLIIAPTLSDATQGLLTLTGKPPVPPRWTFGYMQSRWGWKDQAYVDDTLKEFQNRKLPIDAFIFDFEWYTKTPDYAVKAEGLPQFPDFEFNPKLFPDPKKQIDELHAAGVHFVGIRKPRMGDSDTLMMLRSKGMSFNGGKSFDARGVLFSNPLTRDWYAAQTQPLLQAGVDGWWNDEGEFTYGNYLFWNMAERQALDVSHPEARLWTLNRAFQPGLSRLGAAAWSGDIRARWEDLQKTPTTLLNWGLAGMPYAACDIGGFSGNDTPELLTRWMEAGAFFPIMRTHSDLNATPHFAIN
jgi:alpha-glucosidase